MRVLVVEDDEATAELIRLCLAMRWPDAAIDAVAEGAMALARVAEGHPDIVLLDLGLPDRDGLEVLRDIRGSSDVPVIVLSGWGEESTRKGLEMGATDYLAKPFVHSDLQDRVEAAIRRQ